MKGCKIEGLRKTETLGKYQKALIFFKLKHKNKINNRIYLYLVCKL